MFDLKSIWMFMFPGRKWWSEHWELSLLSAPVHGAVAERSDLWRHHGRYEEVSVVTFLWFLLARKQNAPSRACRAEKQQCDLCLISLIFELIVFFLSLRF